MKAKIFKQEPLLLHKNGSFMQQAGKFNKKNSLYKYAGFIIIMLMVIYPRVDGAILEKKIQKEYDINQESEFNIENKHGDIDYYNWEKDLLQIQVVITAESSDESTTQRILDAIHVEFEKEGNKIYAETQIEENINRISSGLFSLFNGEKSYSIDYTIHAPSYLNLNLANKYGNTFINEAAGITRLDIRYGNLKANKIVRGNEKPFNQINLAYGDASIEETGWLQMDIKYSEMEIEQGETFILESRYSKFFNDQVGSLMADSKYDKFSMGEISNMVIETDYSKIDVDELDKKLEMDIKYTSVDIDYIPAGFQEINIENKYGKIEIGIDSQASYHIDGEAGYCKIHHHSPASVNRIEEHTEMNVSGLVGTDQSTTSQVVIETKYGNVDLRE